MEWLTYKQNKWIPILLNVQDACKLSLRSSNVRLLSSVESLSLSDSKLSLSILHNPLNYGTPGFSVHQQPLEFAQMRVHRDHDAIQPSHLLSSPSPPAFFFSQNQGFFKWVSSSQQVAKILEFQLKNQSFQWIFRTDFPWDWLVGSPFSPRDSQESSSTQQFKSINSLVLSFLYSTTHAFLNDYWRNHSFD